MSYCITGQNCGEVNITINNTLPICSGQYYPYNENPKAYLAIGTIIDFGTI